MKWISVSYDFETGSVTSREDIEKLLTAYRTDYIKLGDIGSYDSLRIAFEYSESQSSTSTLLSLLGADDFSAYIYSMIGSGSVPANYTETRKAMREIGVLDESGRINRQSPYYQSRK